MRLDRHVGRACYGVGCAKGPCWDALIKLATFTGAVVEVSLRASSSASVAFLSRLAGDTKDVVGLQNNCASRECSVPSSPTDKLFGAQQMQCRLYRRG
jgi:hypothetical protein